MPVLGGISNSAAALAPRSRQPIFFVVYSASPVGVDCPEDLGTFTREHCALEVQALHVRPADELVVCDPIRSFEKSRTFNESSMMLTSSEATQCWTRYRTLFEALHTMESAASPPICVRAFKLQPRSEISCFSFDCNLTVATQCCWIGVTFHWDGYGVAQIDVRLTKHAKAMGLIRRTKFSQNYRICWSIMISKPVLAGSTSVTLTGVDEKHICHSIAPLSNDSGENNRSCQRNCTGGVRFISNQNSVTASLWCRPFWYEVASPPFDHQNLQQAQLLGCLRHWGLEHQCIYKKSKN